MRAREGLFDDSQLATKRRASGHFARVEADRACTESRKELVTSRLSSRVEAVVLNDNLRQPLPHSFETVTIVRCSKSNNE